MQNVTHLPPRYDHDHDDCAYLGRHDGADLYFCVQGGVIPTVIARFSSDAPDYISGMPLADHNAHLHEARARAIAAGLHS